ncbi:hypothetical protein kam1_187 [Methylacidiphilum kamchatkense Kam1]|uniref:Uncharacterized protein n=2 Tax=Methylacidiphilum kamchatkense TaxID=431057 RepID=A0A516TJP7_9BACT|nr:hypothetical protein kam1_187 [Methylacidiphilum kamchatkense Kam1]
MGTRLYVAAIILVVGTQILFQKSLSPLQEVTLYFFSIVLISTFTAIYTTLGESKRSSGRI